MLNKIFNYLSEKDNVYAPREDLNSLRLSLLQKQLLHAFQKVPYYKNSFNSTGIKPDDLKTLSDLALFPVITKDIVRQNYRDLFNQKAIIKNSFKSHTSGSTGQPSWTNYDIKSWIKKKYFHKVRARLECGTNFHDRVVIFEPSTASQIKRKNLNLLSAYPILNFRIFSLFDPYELTIHKLKTFSPQALYGTPSHFFRIAQFMVKMNYKLPSVKRIFTSSEYLQDTVRKYIERVFNADVFDIYGSTEFKEVAWECDKHEGYHINEDGVIVEVLHNGAPAEHGMIGDLVITDLRNTVMPLIRYQLLDKGMLIKDQCSCGRTFSLMKPLAGRASEHVILPDGRELSPYLFTTSIEKIEGLLQYQIIQESMNLLMVLVVTNSIYFDEIAVRIKKILSDIVNHRMKIEVRQSAKIDIEENGKFKVVKNLIGKEEVKI